MPLSPYSYYEIKIFYRGTDSQKGPRIGDFLSRYGINLEEIAFCETPSKTYAAAYTRSPKILKRIHTHFKRDLGRGFLLKTRLLVKEDWFDKWQRHYKIMSLGTRFTLIPLWEKRKYQQVGKRVPILLDPKGASGSGQHPTTQIMTLFMERIEGKFKDCLDLGTGTGILGVVAAKLGADKVIALDNDSIAVKAARFNLRLNHVPLFEVSSGDVTSGQKRYPKYDLVCANLISPVLDEIKTLLFGSVRKGGYLAVSGIYIDNFSWFKKQFQHSSFRCMEVLKKKKWTGLLFRRHSA